MTRPLTHGEPSAPRFRVREERDTLVTLADGTRLAVDVFRPDGPGVGPVPALVAVSPYGKDVQHMGVPQQPAHSITFDHSVEAGNVEFFVSRGYAMVIGDLRGTGKSEGAWWGFYNGQDQRDTAELVEWAARQPWCDGNVGMSGHSYFGG
ncbi:MAG: CocE/NonD family hydrolase, partial [Chloroflexi bacterium]|nr:CocE/NonD family hydrolase [Chloroflexota bacterium]